MRARMTAARESLAPRHRMARHPMAKPRAELHAAGIINATGISILLWAVMLRLIFG